jgi:manganese-transporting P-type ATPase
MIRTVLVPLPLCFVVTTFARIFKPKASSGTESTDEYATAEKYDELQQAEIDLQDVEEDINERNESSNGDGVFIPGAWPTAETLVQLSQLGNNKVGLTDKDVKDRYRAVGMNTIEMTKPSFIKQLGLEFSRPFYTYQMFLIWSWFPLYYYYMVIVIGFMVTSSAFVVALFHYNNLSNLYKITHIKGFSHVLRNGVWTLVDQRNLLPGDLVKVDSGVTYCDMVLLRGDNVLVDESALTGESTPQVKVAVDASSDPKVSTSRTLTNGTLFWPERPF